ncbi:hypothetical protein A1O3_05646 [Capronia epimyces CBS 606.96]|uniref:Zn(2)-C6 fungal-type domain-containing protein n=1 Tax=Capronia epimyces CBS 606.96 TaxID=1182542 RepID=W9Y6W4_9EURO|nr:uncharacterized protein A1O3_05646 [Capronia epimyces CBS 606.96]EXJ84971.1 hypothetical protein A1O3_05646 [Capronia epimyces CBS 606.96]
MAHRTNSLAFAKSDCHTCKTLRRVCDRQRPICTTCQTAGDACEGFQTRLIWEGSDLPSRRGDDSRRRHGIECRPAPVPPEAKTAAPTPTPTPTAITIPTPTAKRVAHANSGVQSSKSPPKRAREFSFVNWPPKRRKRHSRRSGQEPQEVQGGSLLRQEEASATRKKVVADPGPVPDKPSPPIPKVQDPNPDPDLESVPLSTEYTPFPGPAALQATEAEQTMVFRSPGFDNWMLPDTTGVEELPLFRANASLLDGIAYHETQQQPSAPAWLTAQGEAEEQIEGLVVGAARSISAARENEKIHAEWSLGPTSRNSIPMTLSMAMLRTQPAFDFESFTILASIPPQVRYSTTADQFSVLLDRYDQEFCTYPVTNDLDINPFRYRRETSRGSKHLLHAIIAIACHHQNSYSINSDAPEEFYQHKNQAVALYKAANENPEIQAQGLEALDTLLALWCIDTVESALNPWRAHLSHAYSLLELAGGIDVWSLSFRSQTQVTMLWDAVVALLSRRACVMPFSYFEAVLQWEASRFWTFFELIGCPRELFVPLMQLAHLASQSKSKGRARNATKEIVTEIEGNLRSYQPPGNEAAYELGDEESLQQARDRYHCCEAIRYSLLIYALRVFRVDNTDAPEPSFTARLRYLSRVSLDHVCSIRPSSPTQKQLLLPIFLAGAETTIDRHRDFIRDYCRQWFETFGYHMFTSVIGILEEVWAAQDVGGRTSWWGDVVDAQRQASNGELDFCFG